MGFHYILNPPRISRDLTQHEILHAKVGKAGINIDIQIAFVIYSKVYLVFK